MVTAIPTPERNPASTESLITLRGVSWQTYKTLMAEVGENRAWRISYHQGVLELRMPLEEHEEPKILISSFVEALADELEIEIRQLGALTLDRPDLTRAIEPDTCFYIQNESAVRGKKIQLPDVPPPDLVFESDYTSSSINKFYLYAGLEVPELWRYRNQTLQVYLLQNGNYQPSNTSLAFPILPIAEIPKFIEQSQQIGQRSAVRSFRKRIRELLQK